MQQLINTLLKMQHMFYSNLLKYICIKILKYNLHYHQVMVQEQLSGAEGHES